MITRPVTLASVALLLCACAGAGGGPATRSGAGVGNAIVIEDEDIDSSRGSLLNILQDHISGMSYSRDDVCPRIVLRGGMSRSATSAPIVYVDGQRMTDTCVLETLNADAIGSIEVYTSGVTTRPGYYSHNGGLILIFMRQLEQSQPRGQR